MLKHEKPAPSDARARIIERTHGAMAEWTQDLGEDDGIERAGLAAAREALLIAMERVHVWSKPEIGALLTELTDGNQGAAQSSGHDRGSEALKTTQVSLDGR